MPTEVLMPALSPTMEKGNLSKWLKKEGDTVKSGDVIAEIETDKATMEVEAVDEGTLGKILVPEGTNDVAVNTPIAMILADGEDATSLKDGKPANIDAIPEPKQKTAAPAPAADAAKAPFVKADLVVDATPNWADIDAALARLETIAAERGVAIGTASALPLSIERIARWAKAAKERGIRIVPLSAILPKAKQG